MIPSKVAMIAPNATSMPPEVFEDPVLEIGVDGLCSLEGWLATT